MKCKNYLLNLLENIPLWYEDVQLYSITDLNFSFFFIIKVDYCLLFFSKHDSCNASKSFMLLSDKLSISDCVKFLYILFI